MSNITLVDNNENTALAIAEVDKNLAAFNVFSLDQEELEELRADMGVGSGGSLGRFDLPKIKMPSAGLLQFILPDGSTAKEIRGIISSFKDTRVFYSNPDTQGTPPDCTSEDCHCGFGKVHPAQENAGVTECAKCPNNQWGSHPKGTGGKACSERRLLAIQMENGLVPALLSLPVTSVKPFTEAMRGIVNSHGATINNFIVTLALEEKMNKKGIKYATVTIKPDSVTKIDPSLKPQMKAMRNAAKAMLDSVPAREIVADDYVDVTGAPGFDS
jgi:hypothetical protein